MRRISFLPAPMQTLLCAGLLSLASCENATGPKLGRYTLTAVSGDGQTQGAGELLPAPLRVRLLAGERPLSGVLVYWATDSGLLDGDASRTDVNGYSNMGWSMGPTPGQVHAVAQVPNAGTVAFTATVTVGAFARLRLTPDSVTLQDVGDTATVAAASQDRFGNAVDKPTLTWVSRAPGVATVSATGQVRGVNGGTAIIVVTALGVKDSVTVVVRQQAASVRLHTRAATVRSVRATTTLRADVLDRLGNPIPGATPAWSTLDPLIVAVDAKGVVTAVGAGVGRVRVAAGAGADTAQVTVVQVAKRIVMLPTSANLPAGDSMLIQPTAYDSLGSVVAHPSFVWYSADSTIVRALSGGWALGLRGGSTRVYANAQYAGEVTAAASTLINVRAGPIVLVTVRPDTATLRVGDTRALSAVATDALGNVAANPTVLWTSSDTSRVTVSSSGVVTAVRLGSAAVYATVAGISGSARVNVATALPRSVRVTRDRDTLNYLGATRQLTAYVYDGSGNQIPSLTPTWTALDPGLMSVTPAGVATELVDGGALARAVASYSGAADTVTIMLRQVPRSITVNPTTLALHVGDSSAVSLTVGPDSGGAAVGTVAVNESNTAVARARWSGSTPYVVGVGAGTATIQFYAGGATLPTATVTVTVSAPSPGLVPVEPTPGVQLPAAAPARRQEGAAGS